MGNVSNLILSKINTALKLHLGDKWWLNGYHPNGKERLDLMTSVGDCSIYDG